MKLPTKYWLIIFFILGILFRLWFVNLVPQPFGGDQEEYHKVALDLLGKHENAYTGAYRLWGYPMLLALDYSIFGTADPFGWKVFQAAMDSLTGIIVFLIAYELFKNKKAAWIGFILYLFNPFIAAYVGVRLTEIVCIFLVTGVFYLVIKFIKTKAPVFLFLLAFLLGFLPFVRPGYLFFSLIVFVWLIRRVMREMRVMGVVMMIIFILPFVYNMARNYRYFGQPALVTVDNLFVREFYISLYMNNYDNEANIPIQINRIYREFSTAKNAPERRTMAQKYLELGVNDILSDPVKFMGNRIKKMWFVWEKHRLFAYENPVNPILNNAVYIINILLLVVAGAGFGFAVKKMKDRWFLYMTLFLAVYISVLHAFTITAERFSLPAYPLVFLFAGYGVYKIAHKFK